jgi:tetratricopeptide (TPR) repeat protein
LVKSQLDEAGLKAIATATAGAYVHLAGQGEDYEAFLKTVFGSVTKHDLIYRQQKIYTQRYQWPLTASLMMLLASLMVGTRRSRRRRAPTILSTVTVSAVSILMGVLIIPMRSESADQANGQSAMGDARTPIAEYNQGTSAYRAGQFPQASQSFQQSIKIAPASDAKRLADQEDAYYNLGNARYRAGQQLEKSAPQEAIQNWTEAVKAYDTALQLRADDADSKFNRDFVNRKIDALRKPPDQGGGGGGGGAGGGGGGGGSGHGPGNDKGQAQGQAQGQPPPQVQPQQSPPQSPKNDSRPPDQHAGPGEERNDRRSPGQMSVEEAGELLDSAKSDEHQSLAVPSGPRDPDQAPDKAFKNW